MELSPQSYTNEVHASPEEFLEIDEWRERTLTRVLQVVLMLAIVGSFPYTYFAVTRGISVATFLNAGSIVLISIALPNKSLPYQVRALCLLIIPYAIGTTTLFMYGTLTLLYMVAFAITTVIFLGNRYAIGAIALASLTLFIGGQFTNWQPALAGIESDRRLVRWALLAFDYACISGALTLACGILLGKVEMSLRTQKLAAHSVELRQQEITRLKQELHAMRQWTNQNQRIVRTEVAAKD
ncbi:MAG: hypothetical protein H0U64_13705 [Gemmatimonadaceae bacterium]|nr:hypothetical protein [Gemmatimonadaceae bacterium]